MSGPPVIRVLKVVQGVPSSTGAPSFASIERTSDGSTFVAVSPAPTGWVDHGAGLYTLSPPAPPAGSSVVYVVDAGSDADERYRDGGYRDSDFTGGEQPGSAGFRASLGGPPVVDVSKSRFELRLLRRYFEELGLKPLVAGDDFSMGFQVLDAAGTSTVDLTGYLILSTMKKRGSGALVLARRSDAKCGGAVPWQAGHAYAVGAAVTNDSGKVYACAVAGTSAGSGGPTGTGSAIVDGGAVWSYAKPSAVSQLTLDDQSIDNGPEGTTGRGWFRWRSSALPADRDALLAAPGIHEIDLRLVAPTTLEVDSFASGLIEVVEPETLLAA